MAKSKPKAVNTKLDADDVMVLRDDAFEAVEHALGEIGESKQSIDWIELRRMFRRADSLMRKADRWERILVEMGVIESAKEN